MIEILTKPFLVAKDWLVRLHRQHTAPEFAFVGPPCAGKTVYFVCAMDRLQRLANDRPRELGFAQFDEGTLAAHTRALRAMKGGSWPQKTPAPQELAFEFSRHFGLGAFKLGSRVFKLVYHDYPGEAFDQAFGDSRAMKDVVWSDSVKNLRLALVRARGIFVVVDTPKFHDADDDQDEFYLQLFNLFAHLQQHAHAPRVAVIFTKKDLFVSQPDFHPERLLEKRYPAAWHYLHQKVESKCFFVSAVTPCRVDKQGNITPPEGYETTQSEGLMAPLNWMLNLNL